MISVVLVSSAIFLTLYQMLRQKQMSSVCTNWNRLQGTSKVEMLHMLQTEPSELSLLVFQYCQLSKHLQNEKITTVPIHKQVGKCVHSRVYVDVFALLLPPNFQFVNENKTLTKQVF